MIIKMLASGSKGNSAYIETEGTKILIDVGINYLKIKKSLGKNTSKLDGVLITHTHSDHIGGLSSLIKKEDIKVYIKEALLESIQKIVPEEQIVIIDEEFNIKDINIKVINGSHDVPAFGFILENKEKSIVYLTDTGYINRKYHNLTKDKTVYIIESNHDEKMLMEGSYPYILKQRIISDKGHLSNIYTGQFLKKVIGPNTKYIVLAHISENNNTPELAIEQVSEQLASTKFDLNNLIAAKQFDETESIDLND